MPQVTFIDAHGESRTVEGEAGATVMEVAIRNGVPGIEAECGGACACATCHCYIEGPLAGKLPEIGEAERSMLEMVEGVTAASRLACQITVSGDLEGLVVRTPQSQH